MTGHQHAEPEGPRRADAIANRARLLDAARVAFAQVGATADVRDIAERAGVGVGTIYRHFGNKEDLLREVIAEAIAEFDREAVGWEKVGDPVESLRQFVTALLTMTENYGWLFDAVVGGQLPEHVIEGVEKDGTADIRLLGVLKRGVEAGAFAPDLDLLVAANLLLGLTIAWKYGKLQERMSLEEAVERSLHVFLQGAARRA